MHRFTRMMAANLAIVLADVMGVAVASLASASVGGPSTAQGATPRRVVDDVPISSNDFSNPTEVTNLLAPISTLAYVAAAGKEKGRPRGYEVTLSPDTKTISSDGGATGMVVARDDAVLDGELIETAYDWFPQDDAGNLWYFGENVTNYEHGQIKDDEDLRATGIDGPPGMIMAAHPKLGDVF